MKVLLITLALTLFLLLSSLYSIFTVTFFVPTLLATSHYSCTQQQPHAVYHETTPSPPSPPPLSLLSTGPSTAPNRTHGPEARTQLRHIAFGIAASAKHWDHRKKYVKLWWRPGGEMRGAVWMDSPVDGGDDGSLPPVRVSGDTSGFKYTRKNGHRYGIRISRIVSETVRLGMGGLRWVVMGDDDTFFVPDNLVEVLAKYDHRKFYYVGGTSETHVQNIGFSYGMAYGGGGFAVSYPLAVALEKMQDRCIERYPELYGSDDRIKACMAELGVPLTREVGFHQCDLYGNLFGLLAAHPVAPLVSLHHLDLVEPIFPNMDRVQALRKLAVPTRVDSAGLMQQSICYYRPRSWTVSVSWGYAVQIHRGVITPREMELPPRTFSDWYRESDPVGFTFNTRPVSNDPCQVPSVYVFSHASVDHRLNRTATNYLRHRVPQPEPGCEWKTSTTPSPSRIQRIRVYNKPDPFRWSKPPRRDCCRVLATKKKGIMVIDVGACKEGEIIALK